MKYTPYLVFIDGQDRCGKTSVCKQLFECRGKIDNVIDRGPLSNYVYSKMYNRLVNINEYVNYHKLPTIFTFYLNVSNKELKRRTIESNDFFVPVKDIPKHKIAFEKAISVFIEQCRNVYIINCDNKTVDQIVFEIQNILDNKK